MPAAPGPGDRLSFDFSGTKARLGSLSDGINHLGIRIDGEYAYSDPSALFMFPATLAFMRIQPVVQFLQERLAALLRKGREPSSERIRQLRRLNPLPKVAQAALILFSAQQVSCGGAHIRHELRDGLEGNGARRVADEKAPDQLILSFPCFPHVSVSQEDGKHFARLGLRTDLPHQRGETVFPSRLKQARLSGLGDKALILGPDSDDVLVTGVMADVLDFKVVFGSCFLESGRKTGLRLFLAEPTDLQEHGQWKQQGLCLVAAYDRFWFHATSNAFMDVIRNG